MKTIIIANQKGGTGKTTTAVTLASGFAALGKETLLIDTDSQGNIAYFLGLEPSNALFEITMGNHHVDTVLDFWEAPRDHVSLSVVNSSRKTTAIEATFNATPESFGWTKHNLIANILTQPRPHYDLCIIDTAPALSTIQEAALYAADYLIVPAIPEYASEAGIAQLAKTVEEIDAPVRLLGILPTMVDSRSNEHAETIESLHETFGVLVLPRVRRLISLGEAPRAGLPIWWYEPNGQAAKDWARVVAEVEDRVWK